MKDNRAQRAQRNLYGEPRTPQEIRDSDGGLRPSHQALLELINTADPAWPSITAVLREMADAGVEIDQAAYEIAAKIGAHRFAIAVAQKHPGRRSHHQATLAGTSDSIVYYVRRGDLIKIGTTANPAVRFDRLMPDEILAFEPGDADQETLRHRQFDHLRCHGEHFRSAPELLEHIRQLRHLHGDPDPAWPSAAIPRKNRDRLPLPPLDSHETMTASEACKRLDLKVNTVLQWVHRGLISPVGRNDQGRYIFYAEHLAVVRDRTAWRRRAGKMTRR